MDIVLTYFSRGEVETSITGINSFIDPINHHCEMIALLMNMQCSYHHYLLAMLKIVVFFLGKRVVKNVGLIIGAFTLPERFIEVWDILTYLELLQLICSYLLKQ